MVSTGNVLPEDANRLRMVFTGKLLTEEVIDQYNFTVGLIARRRRKKMGLYVYGIRFCKGK